MRRTYLVLVVAAVTMAAARTDEGAKRDQEKIQGLWGSTEVTSAGKKVDREVRAEFKGDKVTMIVESGGAYTGTFKLDPGKSPATMDITIDDDGKKRTVPAIYEVKGDELKLCHAFETGDPRPSAFKATTKTVLVTFKRRKP
ncbi:MAG: TIGR03067 domain-containing protein [Planctomycetes bacterium]|nr:TIGR03067 domain-containing protein [Planctomycetota bacterium]